MDIGCSDARRLEIHENLTVSEFNEIHLGESISRDDSNGEVRFIIQDLERILVELPIFLS